MTSETEKDLLPQIVERVDALVAHSDEPWIFLTLTTPEARTISRVLREAAEGRSLQEENSRLRQHIAHIHNRVRHELSAAIQAASDKAFEAMAGANVLRPLSPSPAKLGEGQHLGCNATEREIVGWLADCRDGMKGLFFDQSDAGNWANREECGGSVSALGKISAPPATETTNSQEGEG